MALERDSLSTLISRIDSDIASNLPNYVTGLRYSVENVLARALAGVVHGLHGHLVYLSKQVFPDTAEGEYLERIAGVYGIERIEGVKATGVITFYSVAAGTVVPAGTVWVSPTGVRFIQDAEQTTVSLGGGLFGKASVAITAADKGAAGNISTSVSLQIETAQAGLTGNAIITTATDSGADDETDEALLARLLNRLRNPPRGGAASDYVSWALEVSGVTRAWAIERQYGVGTIGVSFVRDAEDPIIPSSGEIATVQAYIDARRPATADARVFALTPVNVAFDIDISPNNPTVRSAIETALESFFSVNAAPGTTIRLSQLNEMISSATGETYHVLNSPNADVVQTNIEIAVIDSFTFGDA